MMTVEQALRDTLATGGGRDDEFRKQLSDFKSLENRLKRGGYTIERKGFSIPLMERLGVSYLAGK